MRPGILSQNSSTKYVKKGRMCLAAVRPYFFGRICQNVVDRRIIICYISACRNFYKMFYKRVPRRISELPCPILMPPKHYQDYKSGKSGIKIPWKSEGFRGFLRQGEIIDCLNP